MIFNLDPIGGAPLPATPAKPPGEPFHPACVVIDGARIQRRVARLLHAGEAQAALALAESANKAMPGLFIVHLHGSD